MKLLHPQGNGCAPPHRWRRFIRRGDGERYFFPLTAVTVAVALIVCPTGVGALWRTAMKPPTVVCFGGRQGARAATAASSIRADKTGVARTCREPL